MHYYYYYYADRMIQRRLANLPFILVSAPIQGIREELPIVRQTSEERGIFRPI